MIDKLEKVEFARRCSHGAPRKAPDFSCDALMTDPDYAPHFIREEGQKPSLTDVSELAGKCHSPPAFANPSSYKLADEGSCG